MTTVPKNQRQEFLAAKLLVTVLENDLRTLSNSLWDGLGKVEEEVTRPFDDARKLARGLAIDKYAADHAADYARMEELKKQAHEARRQLAGYQYNCDHKDEQGNSALAPQFGYGLDPSDKHTVKCTVCGETWK